MGFDAHLNSSRNNNPYFSNPDLKVTDLSTTLDATGLSEGSKKYVYTVISKTSFKATSSHSLIGKAFNWAGKQLQSTVRALFPSRLDLLDKKVAILNNAFSARTKPSDILLALGEGHKITQDEVGELLDAWLHSYLKEAGNEEPLNRLCHLMYELAEGDILDDVRKEMKAEVNAIIENKDVKQQFPLLRPAVSYFVQMFDEEKKFEASFTSTPTTKCLQTLLAHPNLLKQKDVIDLVNKMPENALRQQVMEKMNKVSLRVLNKAHEQENEIVSAFSQLLQKLSFDEIKQKYSSDPEKNYLQSRLEVVNQKIEEIEPQLQGKENFNLRLLKFEQKHLMKQLASMEAAQTTLDKIDTIPINSNENIQWFKFDFS